jgi:hypothetical protein
MVRCELRRAPRSDQIVHAFIDFKVQNSGGADIRFFSLLSSLEKVRVLVNSVEVQHFNSNQICRYATKRGWLEMHRDEKERDNSWYSESGEASFLNLTNNIQAVTVPAGGSKDFHCDLTHLIPWLRGYICSATGLLEIELTLSQVATEVCDGTLSDLTMTDIRVWTDHKHYAQSIPSQLHASQTLHYSDVEIYRIPATSTPFTAGVGQPYDHAVNLLHPLRQHISRLSCWAYDPAGTDPFINNEISFIGSFDVLRNGVSFRENMLDKKTKLFSHVSRYLRAEGTYSPTNPAQTNHAAAFNLEWVSMTPVVEHKGDILSEQKTVIPSETSNRDNLVFRVTNDRVLPATAQIVFVLECDVFYRISPSGGVVRVEG